MERGICIEKKENLREYHNIFINYDQFSVIYLNSIFQKMVILDLFKVFCTFLKHHEYWVVFSQPVILLYAINRWSQDCHTILL